MMNGFVHLVNDRNYDSQIFIPLKYQTMIEISAYSGFDLAIGVCHIFGFGNFIKESGVVERLSQTLDYICV